MRSRSATVRITTCVTQLSVNFIQMSLGFLADVNSDRIVPILSSVNGLISATGNRKEYMVDITSTRHATISPDQTNLGQGVTWKIKLGIVPVQRILAATSCTKVDFVCILATPLHQSRLHLQRTNLTCYTS